MGARRAGGRSARGRNPRRRGLLRAMALQLFDTLHMSGELIAQPLLQCLLWHRMVCLPDDSDQGFVV